MQRGVTARGGRAAWMAACGALIGALGACGHGPDVHVRSENLERHTGRSGDQVGAPVVVISEPFFSGDFEPYQVYQKTWDVVSALTRASVPTIAPWEYRQLRSGQGLMLDTDVGLLLRNEGISPDEAIQMDVRVVMLGGSARVGVLEQRERLVRVRSAEQGEIRIKLRDLSEGRELASLVVGFVEDGLSAAVTSRDQTPALTLALQRSVALIVEMLADHYAIDAGRRPLADLRFNPKPMFTYTTAYGREPLEARFEDMDALDSMVSRMRFYQYFDPEISIEHLMDFESRGGGLLVAEPGDLREHGLEEGDFILAVGDHPALGAQVLFRPLLQRRQQAVILLIERGGRPAQVILPLQEPRVEVDP